METNVVYGSELAKELRAGMRERIEKLKEMGHRVPCLAVVLVGNHPASESYVKGKTKACADTGLDSRLIRLPADVSQAELEETIRQCNDDDGIDGILLQLPLPASLDEDSAILCIDPDKDVDGLHPLNVGNFTLGYDAFVPCTPLGCMEILKKMDCAIDGKNAVVIGRSKLVGTPIARLLQNSGATVTVCHSHTKGMEEICKRADILIAAIGKPQMITEAYVKEGAYVIDVGINRTEDGHLVGDVAFDRVQPIAKAITPVPKGVGPMTICMLLSNTIKAYERRQA